MRHRGLPQNDLSELKFEEVAPILRKGHLLTAPGAATVPGGIWVTAPVLSTAAAAVAGLIWVLAS